MKAVKNVPGCERSAQGVGRESVVTDSATGPFVKLAIFWSETRRLSRTRPSFVVRNATGSGGNERVQVTDFVTRYEIVRSHCARLHVAAGWRSAEKSQPDADL